MKKICMLLTFLLFVITVNGCGNTDDESVTNTMINTSEGSISDEMDGEIENNSDIQVEDDSENMEEDNIVGSFISDSEEMSIDGISHTNKESGGWVTEQGDWNYYAIWDRPINGEDKHYILKENIVTGEKYQIMTYDDHIYNISVMGDWIYFSISADHSCIARIRTDGQYYGELTLDTEEKIRDWFTYDGDLFAIVPEHVSASQVDDYIVKVNWESGAYEKIYNCGNEGFDSFLGTEIGYAFFVKETKIQEEHADVYYEYEFKRVSLNNPDEDVFSVNYNRLQDEPAPDIWRINNGLILGFKGNYGMIAEWTENYFIWAIDLFNFKEVFVREIPELNNLRYKTLLGFDLNFYHDRFLLGLDSIIAVGEEGTSWTTRVISEDSAFDLSVANNRIYYEASYDGRHMYCYLDEDGTWYELKVENFMPINEIIQS